MVTDEERDYMYSQYAADPEMRLNVGIRRRLAPLMENSRPRIELMNSLLFSMPGTPIIYYGDEIGMGDNVYLGDRNGVRTPMQWNSDRNAGFSRTDPARLYFPVIMDPVYGYEAINVEAQERSPFSLLHWMKRMIALRRQHPVFGRGSLAFIRTDNRKVLTYVRRDDHETMLCVANLSRAVQPVEIPLGEFAGLTPVELLGQTQLPRIGEQPYFLTLAPYGFYWLRLQEVVVPATSRVVPLADEHPAVPSLFAGVVWDAMLDGSMRGIIEKQALVPFLERQRWFGGKARPVLAARFVDWATLRHGAHPAFLSLVEVQYRDGGRERYMLPLAMASGPDVDTIAQQHRHAVLSHITGARKGLLYDGLFDDGACALLLEIMRRSGEIRTRYGRMHAAAHDGLAAVAVEGGTVAEIRRTADHSNTSVLFGWQLIMKTFRRVEPGVNPDVEIGSFLASRGFIRVPTLLGTLSYEDGNGEPMSLVTLQRFVSNQGNAWDVTIEELGRFFDRAKSLASGTTVNEAEIVGPYIARVELLGRRTGELHVALASARADEAAFSIEPFSPAEIDATAARLRQHAAEQLAVLESALPGLDDVRAQLAGELLRRREDLTQHFDAMTRVRSGGSRIRCHGDYHLGQVLVAEADMVIIDFEGEPARSLWERRQKYSPLRDVAGMLRSFSYAALTGLSAATLTRPEDLPRLSPWAHVWEAHVTAAFRRGYVAAVAGTPLIPQDPDEFDALLRAFVVEKAMYELGYELNNRPDWLHIPITGLLNLRSIDPA
jgi:maltose alpha-D-glucosyltransferase/alpha-amylase